MQQRALDWGQSPAESCPKDGNEMSNRERGHDLVGNRVSQEQSRKVIFLLPGLIGQEQCILSVRNTE